MLRMDGGHPRHLEAKARAGLRHELRPVEPDAVAFTQPQKPAPAMLSPVSFHSKPRSSRVPM